MMDACLQSIGGAHGPESPGLELPPLAPMLMQSLRAFGYSGPAALADLVDNSIAAEARIVAITFAAIPDPFVAIVDDGRGMDEAQLVAAMRFGSRDPREARRGIDLGRFGLGLKTASLSQCRRVTVASVRGGRLSVAAWDLDECDRRRTWWLERPDESAVHPDALSILTAQGRGTAVIWQELDRLLALGSGENRSRLDEAMEGAADYLALSFHRFLSGEMRSAFDICINGRPLPKIDPFLAGHPRGQALHKETFLVEGHPVSITPFVLPFPSRLKTAELERAGGRERLKTAHGFYIYRGGRLVVPGGWFRIVPADELVRLARIQVDVPMELDHIWKVDVRKTMAEPPPALRPHLRRIVGAVTARSRKVYTYRGSPVDPARVPLWVRHELREGAVTWRINRDHPAVMALAAGALYEEGDAERLLRLLEQSLPLHDIHVHISNDFMVADPEADSEVELEALARRLLEAFRDVPEQSSRLLERLHLTDPFSRDPEAAHRIAERLRP
jgi:Histidine kinase-, DNA gyrase B-, and HSP90-like ATPase